MNNMRNKILMTLALLLTAVTGAWAQDTFTITFSANGKNKTYTDVALSAEYKCEYGTPGEFDKIIQELYGQDGGHAIENATPTVTGTTAIIPGLETSSNYAMITIIAPFTGKATVSGTYAGWSNNSGNSDINYSIEVYFGTPSSSDAIDVKWDAATKTGNFVMPAFDVEIAPIYAPVAQWAKVENVDQLPKAIEGIYAESTDAIVKAGTVAKIGETENPQGEVMYAVGTSATEQPALTAFSATLPTAKDITTAGDVWVWYYIKGVDAPDGTEATAENTFNDSEICATPLKVDILTNKFDLTLSPAPVKNMTVTVAGQAATPDQEGKVEAVKMESEVKLKANTGYKFRKVEVKKGGGEPVLLTTITAADNSSFKSGSQTFGDVATVTLTGDNLTNDGSHGGWYCLGSNLTATISVAEANGANITSVKFYTAGGGSAEDKDAPFEVTTTSVTSSNITTYLNGNSIGSYGVSKIEVYGTK